MKGIPSLITALFVFTVSQAHAQISSDMQAMHMIKDFYTAYNSLNLKLADKSKLDALIDKYFTIQESETLKRGYKTGHDIMTNDSGITNRSLETMVINQMGDEKALNIETGKYEINKGLKGAYEVSYVLNPVTPKLNEVTTEANILIDILVVKYNGVIKISRVTNGLTNSLRYHKN
ncbi:hypothetical protein [Mucilaginibacter dorajii]|uniref:Nuclear transport factor 2 family protein n=1 Tax=Mucilaginibacter dorajii TaxID=692994 RepID=A0ABP7QA07_9SPHI|nr:hypothetical protein [Mucilaginibacter dorajii]MCS3737121.1 hypothetical protein [Mucilaginibacter dorajii]